MDFLLGKITEFIHVMPLFTPWLRHLVYSWAIFGFLIFVGSLIWYNQPDGALARIQTRIQDRQGVIQSIEIRNMTLEQIKDTVNELQYRALAFMEAGNYDQAQEILRQADPLLNEAILRSSKDHEVLNLRGYMLKDWALVYKKLGQHSEAEKLLDEALLTFKYVLKLNDKDASAHNGLGSVYILRGKYDLAEEEILTALKIDPDYKAAKHDLDLVRQLKEKAGG